MNSEMEKAMLQVMEEEEQFEAGLFSGTRIRNDEKRKKERLARAEWIVRKAELTKMRWDPEKLKQIEGQISEEIKLFQRVLEEDMQKNFLKNMEKIIRIITMATVVAIFISCQGKQGDPGPLGAAGQNGAQGTAGPTGPTGPDATAAYINGSISGTISGTRKDGVALNETFSLPYASASEGFSALSGGFQTLNLYRASSLFYGQSTGSFTGKVFDSIVGRIAASDGASPQ